MAQTPVSVISSAVSDLDTQLLSVAAVGVGIGATVLAVRKGWGFVKSFIK